MTFTITCRRILGVDPGLQRTGWGVIEQEGSALRYVACGAIVSPPKSPMSERLRKLHEGVQEVMTLYQPETVGIEETFVNKNAASSLKLGQARGAILLSLAITGRSVEEYAARSVKQAVTGSGRAEKGQVMQMVQMLLPNAEIASEDAADALAVAICHAHSS